MSEWQDIASEDDRRFAARLWGLASGVSTASLMALLVFIFATMFSVSFHDREPALNIEVGFCVSLTLWLALSCAIRRWHPRAA